MGTQYPTQNGKKGNTFAQRRHERFDEENNISTVHPVKPKGRFTRYDFVACNLLTTRLQHEKSCRILKHVLKPYDSRGLKSVVRRLHATKSHLVNRP